MKWAPLIALLLILGASSIAEAKAVPAESSGGMCATEHSVLCPQMGGMTPDCGMSPLEHVAMIQGLFTATPNRNFFALALLSILLVALAFTVLDRLNRAPLIHVCTQVCPGGVKRSVALPPPLYQKLFSSGLLNPKYY